MWVGSKRSTLCASANEELDTLADNNPLTVVSLVSQERVQQLTAEVPVEFVSLVSQERVQQRIAEVQLTGDVREVGVLGTSARLEFAAHSGACLQGLCRGRQPIPQERISEQMRWVRLGMHFRIWT